MDVEKISLEELIEKNDLLKNKIVEIDNKIFNDPKNRYKKFSESEKAKSILLNLNEPKKRVPLLKDRNGKIVIPRGKVGLLIAAGGSGKTQLICQLIASLKSDTKWLDTFVPGETKGKILFVTGEEDEDDVIYRLHYILKNLDLSINQRENIIKNVDIFDVSGMNVSFKTEENPFEKVLFEMIVENSNEEGWSLIILDPASRFLPKDAEIDNSAATHFIEECEKLRRLPGNPTIIIAHHVNKNSIGGSKLFSDENDSTQAAARGSSALVDGARFVINIDTVVKEDWIQKTDFANKKLIKIRHSKMNYAPFMETVNAVVDSDNGIIYALSPQEEEDLKKERTLQNSSHQKTKPKKEDERNIHGASSVDKDYF